ncbi:hypothetical protein B7494_g5690 [Chlorociboria aeruginascens]|nr:hypothetical protein B7494_g5690 [Chlorociboria aeruginascens]
MEPGECLTNVLYLNNFASIQYEYFEPQTNSPGIARRHTQAAELLWRQEGSLVYCDPFRSGIWRFQSSSNASTKLQPDDSTMPDAHISEARNFNLSLRDKGVYESSSLVKNKPASSFSLSASSNTSSPSSIENIMRQSQATNARAIQANSGQDTSYEPTTPSPRTKLAPGLGDLPPTQKDIHEYFISAVLNSIVYFLCHDHGFTPLNSRTLISAFSRAAMAGNLRSNLLLQNNIVTLATLDISLTSLGTLVFKAQSDPARGLQCLTNLQTPRKISSQIFPGTALWLAPGGNAARYQLSQNDFQMTESLRLSDLQKSPIDSVRGGFGDITVAKWKSQCLEWLSAKGLNTAALEDGGWILVQIVKGNSPYLNADYQAIPVLEDLAIIPWPAHLCFRASSNRAIDTVPTMTIGSRDPLMFAEEWFKGHKARANLRLKRQKERQITEASLKERADVEARTIKSNSYSSAILRRGSNADAMYPTPPDAVHHPIGTTPTFDGTTSTPGNPTHLLPPDMDLPVPPHPRVPDAEAESWAAAGKKEPINSSMIFNENDGDNIFGDIGGDLFGDTDITDADFSFFDEPDVVKAEPHTSSLGDDLGSKQVTDIGLSTAMDTRAINHEVSDIEIQSSNPEENLHVTEDNQAIRQSPKNNNNLQITHQSNIMGPSSDSPVEPRPIFNQETIFQRLQKHSDNRSPRRASMFDKINFEASLLSVNEKYGARGRFNFPEHGKILHRLEAVEIPKTRYLSERQKVEENQSESRNLAHILTDATSSQVLNGDDDNVADNIMDSDAASLLSDQDDKSPPADNWLMMFAQGAKRKRPLDSEDGDEIISSFNGQSIAPPNSLAGSLFPLLDTDPAGWSLATYFTSPEPDVYHSGLSDTEYITTAQILTDQAVCGIIRFSDASTDTPHSCDNNVSFTKELVSHFSRAVESCLRGATRCTMRSFLEIQGIPVLNQAHRLPPRPLSHPRLGHNSDSNKSTNLFPIPPPQLEVRRADTNLAVLPSAVSFWENLGLGPFKGSKDINAICVCPNFEGVSEYANIFLGQMKSIYESSRLGSHDQIIIEDNEYSTLLFPMDATQQASKVNQLAMLKETTTRLNKILSSLAVEHKNLVVYFFYPVDGPTLLVHICSAFKHLFNSYRMALSERKLNTSNELVLQLVPLDFIYSSTSITIPLPYEYDRLAMEVYDRCIEFKSFSSTPAILLEQPLPKSIDFKLSSTPSASLMQENSCLHIAYARSIDDRWITAAWTDNRGQQQMSASYCLGRKNEPISMPFSDVANEIWETTLGVVSKKKIHWRIMIAKAGIMDQSEMNFWTGLASPESGVDVSLTLITVQTDPSLRLLPDHVTIPPPAVQESQSVITPVSTPQGPQSSLFSPDGPNTPSRESAANAQTPVDTPAENDSDSRLIDYTDQSWGAVLSHRLNNSNSLLELNPALISGYLIKRGGTDVDDPPVVMEVNIVHSDVIDPNFETTEFLLELEELLLEQLKQGMDQLNLIINTCFRHSFIGGPIYIAVIGGTGLQKLDGFVPIATVNPSTPWGYPSAPITILKHKGVAIAFLSRHGAWHQIAPHEVPSRANIAALRSLGVRTVIAFSAVGSLQEEIKPRDFVVPDQIIDRTKGIRPFTFFEKGVVGHVGFADPFDEKIAQVVKECGHALAGEGVTLHDKGTIICMEGPQFSTRAESNLYRSWGGSVINMSALPEAKLAREAEMVYQMICMATDYDCWHSTADVDVEMVMGHMSANSHNAKLLVGAVLDRLSEKVNSGLVRGINIPPTLLTNNTEVYPQTSNPLPTPT